MPWQAGMGRVNRAGNFKIHRLRQIHLHKSGAEIKFVAAVGDHRRLLLTEKPDVCGAPASPSIESAHHRSRAEIHENVPDIACRFPGRRLRELLVFLSSNSSFAGDLDRSRSKSDWSAGRYASIST